jgi:hypothetical protein
MKIQQMAFMLVAVMIFFSMVALVYFSISMSNLKESAEQLKEDEAQAIARQLSGTPELAFTAGSDCASCIDIDKAFAMSQISGSDYGKKFWNLDYLKIEIIYPLSPEKPCLSFADYPDCTDIIIISLPAGKGLSGTKTAFVALARWDSNQGIYRYDLGKVHTLSKDTQNQNE